MLTEAGNQVNANVGDFFSVIILLISLDVLYQGRGLHFPVTPFIGKQDSSSTSLEPRGGSSIFFRRGCTRLLLYFNTNKPLFSRRIPVVLENRRSSQGGGGGCAPPAPSP